MANRKTTLVGIDIGGSKIEAILWRSGRILNVKRIKTPKNRRDFVKGIIGITALAPGSGSTREIAGIGVAMAGAIYKGTILKSPNLRSLDSLNLKAILEKKFKKPVKIDNDTKCFLLAEKQFGQARGKKNVVVLTMGTGVGGAALIEGKLLKGVHGAAGELGHMIMGVRGIKGKRGIDLEDLITRDRRDFKAIGKYLGIGLANIVNAFDPELIILGGGVSNDAKKFLPQALREMKKHTVLPPKFLPQVKVSRLKHTGALGAVALFLP